MTRPILLALVLAGCAATPIRPASTGTTIASSEPGSSSDVETAEAGSSKQGHVPGTCTATLTVHSVQVRPGCTIDERVTQAPGRLVYPCAGGPATATFGASRFSGTVSAAGEVELLIQTGFDFSDGCRWTTKQQITGRIGQPAWSYEYREEPDRGQRGCANGCVATASVRVQQP